MIAVRSKLSKVVLALIAAGVGSLGIASQFIGEREGTEFASYQDAKGVWTICRGHTVGVKPGQTATIEQCDDYSDADLAHFSAVVDRLTTVKLTEPQRAGLTSFCYNVGEGNCAKATLFRKLNAGDRAGGCAEILRWRFVGGHDCSAPGDKVCPGIWTRRQMEYELCLR